MSLQLTTIAAISQFLAGTQAVAFSVATTQQERYHWVRKTLVKLQYLLLGKADKGIVTRLVVTDDKGKQQKKYLYGDMMTPYEKFRSLSKPSQYLVPGNTLKKLDAFATEMNDNEAAEQLNSARDKLFKQLHERLKQKA